MMMLFQKEINIDILKLDTSEIPQVECINIRLFKVQKYYGNLLTTSFFNPAKLIHIL